MVEKYGPGDPRYVVPKPLFARPAMSDEYPHAATRAVIEDDLYDFTNAPVHGSTVFRLLIIGQGGGFGSAPLKEVGQTVTHDDGIALFSAAHPVDLRLRAKVRIRFAAAWFNLRVRLGFALVSLAERISPVRPYENDIDSELLR